MQNALYPPCRRSSLREVIWEEGKIIDLVCGIYWYKLIVQCSSEGKQTAIFADGREHPFFEFAINPSGILHAGNIVPVLPDGRLLMVVEQRGPHALYPKVSRVLTTAGGRNIALGPYGSLEFPGGTIDLGEGVISGTLRELVEETGVSEQEIEIVFHKTPILALGAGIALGITRSVAWLSEAKYDEWLLEDGVAMRVVALSEAEVQKYIALGIINSGQAGILGWQFYQDIKNPALRSFMNEHKSIESFKTRIARK